MRYVTILLILSSILYGSNIYDFWGNSNQSNQKNILKVTPKDTEEYNYTNDYIQPPLANDLDEKKISQTKDLNNQYTKDPYLKYNEVKSEPTLANDINPEKIKRAPDYVDKREPKLYQEIKSFTKLGEQQTIIPEHAQTPQTQTNEVQEDDLVGYKSNYVTFYDENNREESFIELIPYITRGNSLFSIEKGDYAAKILDNSISASITADLGLNYIWDDYNIGYLWNINLGQYKFNEKDKSNTNSLASGNLKGSVLSVMPTIFYELNRAERMSILIGYSYGFAYIYLRGDTVLENSTAGTINHHISINNIYQSSGLLIEVLHNNLMISFTKVNLEIKESDNNIKISENRLNIGYKFSF